jgi:uncharacterized damage-inducible protein DinB
LAQPSLYVNGLIYYSKPKPADVFPFVNPSMKKVIMVLAVISALEASGQVPDLAQVERTWKRHKTYTIELLDALPEEKLSFRPTKESRSFAELIMHIAQSNYGFSAMIVSEPTPSVELFNAKSKTKAQLRLVLSDSFDFLLKHIGKVKTEAWTETFPWGNRLESSTTRTKSEVLAILKEHAAHHRGQATVYLRLSGIEPPSFVD